MDKIWVDCSLCRNSPDKRIVWCELGLKVHYIPTELDVMQVSIVAKHGDIATTASSNLGRLKFLHLKSHIYT